MTSATEELRRLLDERGVEWSPSAWDRSTETYWKTADGNGCLATQGETKLRLSFADYLTPEQAIAATLGAGTCHNASKVMDEHVARLESENAELRELVRVMRHFMMRLGVDYGEE